MASNSQTKLSRKSHLNPSPNPNWAVPIRTTFRAVLVILTALLFVTAVYLAQNRAQVPENYRASGDGGGGGGCDLFSGKWVFDNKSYPLYKESECVFMSDQLACEKFGRKDLGYRNWRWQPEECELPRFNGTALLERLRNKRMVFVGDSLNRGQWVSMVCLVGSVIPASLQSMQSNGSMMIFKATEYNATIEFYWSPLLVESNSDDPVNHRLPDRIVRVKAIEKHATHWADAHILIFNTYLWWRRPRIKALFGSFEDEVQSRLKLVKMRRGYEMALRTWSDWLEVNIHPNNTQLFFMSMSPIHDRGEEWGKGKGENCYGETEQIKRVGYKGEGTDPKMMKIVENVLNDLKTRGLNVQMINITQLSEYRKEGHPSIYRKQWEALKEDQISNPSSYADCIHWCLPGVPDVWNQLLYAFIFQSNNHTLY
ncbi:protein trichome birefringence-like 34 [Cucumis melo var. makuwa]|uniref:Protein trichome birefringence-like 34 n=2 Tax=Cucumis melo TaxID=3656 RepID=A0A5D3CIB7_CUCMM|nr:protein trichome birefringence-like 34 [Cucumis melo]TYK10938.1 protein trichome birefringence-like 34 [Cucumis melo var. makuwa]